MPAAWGVPGLLGHLALQWSAVSVRAFPLPCGNLGKESLQGQNNNFSSFHSIWSWWKRKSVLARKK